MIYALVNLATGEIEVRHERGNSGPPPNRDGKVWLLDQDDARPSFDSMTHELKVVAPVDPAATAVPWSVSALPVQEANKRYNASIIQSIDALEAQITPRRQREAILTPGGKVWIGDKDQEIAALRSQLKG